MKGFVATTTGGGEVRGSTIVSAVRESTVVNEATGSSIVSVVKESAITTMVIISESIYFHMTLSSPLAKQLADQVVTTPELVTPVPTTNSHSGETPSTFGLNSAETALLADT